MFCININVRDDVFKCDLSMIISVTSVIVPSRGIMELIDWNIKNTTSLHTDDNMDNIMPWDIDVGIATWKFLRHEILKPQLQLEKSCHETLKLSLWREKYLTSRDTEATIATWKILCHETLKPQLQPRKSYVTRHWNRYCNLENIMSRDTEVVTKTWISRTSRQTDVAF